ncbi:MAG: hypothetical protein R3D98_16135 [Candidatus Krumholzibacteriia bacterium]
MMLRMILLGCLVVGLPMTAAAQPTADEVGRLTAGLGEGPGGPMGFLEVTFMSISTWPMPSAGLARCGHGEPLVAEGKRTTTAASGPRPSSSPATRSSPWSTFRRDTTTAAFKGALGNMQRAVEADELTEVEARRRGRGLPRGHGPVRRAWRPRGDQLLYRIDGDTLWLGYVGVDGEVLVDRRFDDGVWARAVRASFTGARSKLRNKLAELPWRG